MNRDNGFAGEIVDCGKFEVMPGIAQGRQVFEVEMQQLARSLFFVSPRLRAGRPRQLTHPLPDQPALDGAVSDAQFSGDAPGAESPRPQPVRWAIE